MGGRGGFDVDNVGRLPWLGGADVVYWGDIDTHGFAILDRLRAWLPEARSVLMDQETLLAHRDRWVTEDRPARSALTRLTVDEWGGLYTDLVEGGHWAIGFALNRSGSTGTGLSSGCIRTTKGVRIRFASSQDLVGVTPPECGQDRVDRGQRLASGGAGDQAGHVGSPV